MELWSILGPVLGSATVLGAIVALIVWLVKGRISAEQRFADERVEDAKKVADARAEAVRLAATQQVTDLKDYHERALTAETRRGDELKKTADAFEVINIQLTTSLKEAVEANRIVQHFFSSYAPVPPRPGDNGAKPEEG